jgi:hypothetical protein
LAPACERVERHAAGSAQCPSATRRSGLRQAEAPIRRQKRASHPIAARPPGPSPGELSLTRTPGCRDVCGPHLPSRHAPAVTVVDRGLGCLACGPLFLDGDCYRPKPSLPCLEAVSDNPRVYLPCFLPHHSSFLLPITPAWYYHSSPAILLGRPSCPAAQLHSTPLSLLRLIGSLPTVAPDHLIVTTNHQANWHP